MCLDHLPRRELALQVDENSSVIEHWIEAFNRHDVASIVALYAHDAELFDSGMKHARHGHAEITRWFARRFSRMPSITYTPTSCLFATGCAIVLWTTRGRVLGQSWLSRSFEVDGVSVFTIRDERICKQRGYYDHFATLEQMVPPLKWLWPFRL